MNARSRCHKGSCTVPVFRSSYNASIDLDLSSSPVPRLRIFLLSYSRRWPNQPRLSPRISYLITTHQRQKNAVNPYPGEHGNSIIDSLIKVQYANLTTIDLGEFDKPGGKERLAAQLTVAVHNVGT